MRRIALCGLVSFPPGWMFAGDWPQYRGPNHDGVSTDRIVKEWTGEATNAVWRSFFGNGLSSIAVSGGRVFTQTKRSVLGTDREVCVALSVTNGQELWATPLDTASYPEGGVGTDDGPRSTPAVSEGAVYVLTSYLKLFRLDASDGSVTWQRDLRTLYGGNVIGWQNAASPLVADGLIYVNANSSTDSLMALRTSDGSLAWRSENERMTHSTPVLATIHGVRQVIFATQSGLISLDPQTGDRLWKFTYPFNYSTSLGASPVVSEDLVFATGAHSYGMGSVVLRASLSDGAWTTTRLWWTNNPASHWMTPVAHDGFLYGQFGIQTYDSANAQLKCIDLRTGVQKWSINGFGRGGTLLVDGHVLTLTERGHLVLAKPDTNSYVEVSRFVAIPNYNGSTNKCWNIPAVCDGRVIVRSTAQLACFDLSLPDLRLAAPQLVTEGNRLRLTVGTTDGSPVSPNRLTGLEVRSSTNLSASLTSWTPLTNALKLTNGVIEIDAGDTNAAPERYFIVSEPQ
jgi:outer membrane protein assembly factor BamB